MNIKMLMTDLRNNNNKKRRVKYNFSFKSQLFKNQMYITRFILNNILKTEKKKNIKIKMEMTDLRNNNRKKEQDQIFFFQFQL